MPKSDGPGVTLRLIEPVPGLKLMNAGKPENPYYTTVT